MNRPGPLKHPMPSKDVPGMHSPYRSVGHDQNGENRVDALIERRAPQRFLRREIRRASRELVRALATRRGLWLELEARLARYRQVREQAYFDAGFEHGFVAGQANVARLLLGAGAQVEHLAARLRESALLDDRLSPQQRALALLQTAWAVGFSR